MPVHLACIPAFILRTEITSRKLPENAILSAKLPQICTDELGQRCLKGESQKIFSFVAE
jgi:hypothetical protein